MRYALSSKATERQSEALKLTGVPLLVIAVGAPVDGLMLYARVLPPVVATRMFSSTSVVPE